MVETVISVSRLSLCREGNTFYVVSRPLFGLRRIIVPVRSCRGLIGVLAYLCECEAGYWSPTLAHVRRILKKSGE